MGTEVISRRLSRSGPELRLMVSAIFGIICLFAGPVLSAESEHKYDGVYTGERSLAKGTASSECPAKDNVSVTIHGNALTFTNSELKRFTMPFHPDQDGSFGETYTDEGGTTVHYRGRIVGDVIEATIDNFGTPDCEYKWRLKKD
jgi:hypothetical protein